MTPRTARVALAVFASVAALEWIAAARAYRAQLTPAVWQQAADALAALPPDEAVYLGTPWLGPSARQHLPTLRTPASLAAPDLHGVPRFHVLGLAGSPHAGGWSDELEADLGELPPPTALGVDALGPLRLHHYAQPSTSAPLTDWLATPSVLQLRDDRGPCRLSEETWSCKQGRIALQTLEVAYRPRHCLAVTLDDGATLEVIHPRAQLGGPLDRERVRATGHVEQLEHAVTDLTGALVRRGLRQERDGVHLSQTWASRSLHVHAQGRVDVLTDEQPRPVAGQLGRALPLLEREHDCTKTQPGDGHPGDPRGRTAASRRPVVGPAPRRRRRPLAARPAHRRSAAVAGDRGNRWVGCARTPEQ